MTIKDGLIIFEPSIFEDDKETGLFINYTANTATYQRPGYR